MNQQLTSMKPSITANEGELTVVVRRIRMRNLLLGLLAAAAGVSIPPIVRWVTKAPSTGKTELSNLSIYEMFWVILAVGAASIAVAAALAAREAIRITSDSVTVSESVFIWTVRKATYPLPEIKSIRFGRGRVVLEVRAQNT